MNMLDLTNVPASVPRITRIISPAQEGLLDCTSHVDAPDLVAALDWMKQIVGASVNGGASTAKVVLVDNLIAWLGDVVLEKQGLVLYDGELRPFKDLPMV